MSLSAYNYDSAYGKTALTIMYRGIMEQVYTLFFIFYFYYCYFATVCFHLNKVKLITQIHFQDALPVEPPGCSSEKPETIRDFIENAKAALNSVGIIRDTVLGNFSFLYASLVSIPPSSGHYVLTTC